MLPINKKQLQNQDCYYLDIAVVFFLSGGCYGSPGGGNGSQYACSNDENSSYNHNDVKNLTHFLTAFHRHETVSLEYLRSIWSMALVMMMMTVMMSQVVIVFCLIVVHATDRYLITGCC